MSNEPLCHVGDIVQYDWDIEDNIFLIVRLEKDVDGYVYDTISLANGRNVRYQFGMAEFKVLA